MDLIKVPITLEFLDARVRLSWREVAFGLENELLLPAEIPLLAAWRVATDPEPSAALVELAGQSPGEPHGELVAALASAEPEAALESIQRTWLYLVLAWIFDHRTDYESPLGVVESVYADFGYPSEITPFVRYMPMQGPDLGSREANEGRLYDSWRHYLEETAALFAERDGR